MPPGADPYLFIPCLVLLGAIVIMFIYHFILYINYRDKLIGRYCFYLLCISLYLSIDQYARIDTAYPAVKKELVVSAVNFVAILGYAAFLMETVAAWSKQYRMLFAAWKIAAGSGIAYIILSLGCMIFNVVPGSLLLNVLTQIVRTLFILVGAWATFVFFPLLQGRFLRWIKWGASAYLFFMALVMITMLVIPGHELLGLSAMQYVYLGMFLDVVFFSLAMSYKIKESFYKVTEVRNKLSRDLHDDIGASLSSIQIFSTVAEKSLPEDAGKTRVILNQIRQNAEQVIENMGDIVWAMNTRNEKEGSLSGRIKNYGYELLAQRNIECRYQIDSRAEERLLAPESRKNILLIIKEALNNIAKYSQASRAEVNIVLDKGDFLVSITDNGNGFEPEQVTAGNGLRNMRERTAALGGRFSLTAAIGKGTELHCSIPLTNISDD